MGVDKSPPAFNLCCSAREMTVVVKQAGNGFCFLLSHPGEENGKLPLSLFPKWDTSSSEGTAEPGACSQLAGSLGHLARRPLYSGSLRAPILRRLLAGHTVPEPNELLRLVMQLVLGSCAA